MGEYYCQRYGQADAAAEVFSWWWAELLDAVGAEQHNFGDGERCWWTLSRLATLVLGLPELKVHALAAPAYVHRPGPTLWQSAPADAPSWLARLGERRPAVLVALSTNPVPDTPLAVLAAQAWA